MSSSDLKPASPVSDHAKEVAQLRERVAHLEQQLLRVDQERKEYLQNVAHQLVAPLNAMKWHIENLTHSRISLDRAKKVLRSLYSQASLIVHLARNFYLMSNLEADHALSALREKLEPLDVHRLLINLADDFQPQGWDRQINIRVDDNSFAKVPDVLAIRALVSQVFSNIIENAIKYSHDTSEIVVIGSYSASDDSVTIAIINEGIAIDPTDAGKLFNRGFRSEAARNKYPAGTGFGLYIAKKIMDMHEGTITVSQQSSGATAFAVKLFAKRLQGKAQQWPKKPYY